MDAVRCPTSPGEIVGCGSANVSEPDFEGLVDCFECGIWFNPAMEALRFIRRPRVIRLSHGNDPEDSDLERVTVRVFGQVFSQTSIPFDDEDFWYTYNRHRSGRGQ
jgi:hypothetical protein